MLDEWQSVMEYCASLSHVHVCGIMVIGPHTDDVGAIEKVFTIARELFLTMQKQYPQIQELSMGMSSDYPIALRLIFLHSFSMVSNKDKESTE